MPYTHASSSSSSAILPRSSPLASSSSSDVSDDNLQVNWVSLLQKHFPHVRVVKKTNISCQKAYMAAINFLLKKADSQDERTSQLKKLITDVPQILDRSQQTKLAEFIFDLIKGNSTDRPFITMFTTRLHHCLPADLASTLYEYAIQQHSPLSTIEWAIICDHPLSDSMASHINALSFNAPLQFASMLDKPDIVTALLRLKAEVDHIFYGQTSSMIACRCGFAEVLKRLHQAGADLDVVSEKNGFNLLHIAASSGDIATVSYLLENNPKLINSKNNEGNTPLKVALDNQQFDIAELLIDQTKDLPNDDLILLKATFAGSIKLVESFLRKGSPVDSQSKDGKNALHFAVLRGHKHIVQFLVEKAPELISVTDNFDWTALHYAATKPNLELEIVATILDKIGRDTVLQNSKGVTPTHTAAQTNNVNMLKLLLKNTPQWTSIADHNGQSPLHFTIGKNSIESFKLLMKKAPELITQCDQDGSTALHYAARFNRPEIAIILMQDYPNLADALNVRNLSPLDIAAQFDSVETAGVILKTTPERATRNGGKALHIAAQSDSVQVAELLLNIAPGLAYHKDGFGNTAAHIVAILNKNKVAKLLLEKNKKLFSECNNHFSTAYQLTIADAKGGLEVFKLILKYTDKGSSLLQFAIRAKNYQAIDLIFQSGIFISPSCRDELGSLTFQEISRRAKANAEVYRQPQYEGDRIGTLAGLALRVCREQLVMNDEQIPRAEFDKLERLLPMPIGYTYLGKWFIPQAMANDQKYLGLLEKSQKEPLALAKWFANAPEGCVYDHLAIKLVIYRAFKNGRIDQTIELTDEEVRALRSGQIDSLQTLLKRYPYEQLRRLLNALIEAPETSAFQESCQKCIVAFDRQDLIARLRVLRERRLATQLTEEASRTPQLFQNEQRLIRSKRVSPENSSYSVGPDTKLQRTARDDEHVESVELFRYASSSSSSSSNQMAASSFGYSPDEQKLILEAIAGSEEALNYLNSRSYKDQANWFKNNGNVLMHKRLALKLVTKQFMAANPDYCLQLDDVEESAFCEGKLSFLDSLYDKIPYRLVLSWLEKLESAPETIYLHEVCRELISIFKVRHARERLDTLENQNAGKSHPEPVMESRGQSFFQPRSNAASSSMPVSDDNSSSLASLN